ncbi:MAG TPA: hypothetical protein DEH25_02075 [Chloroflexi bacterium]|nr:hypothetical protein [Chloroflexota bacterium]
MFGRGEVKIYFVRHGESEANLLREFSNRGFKHGLTARGLQQVKQLARDLEGIPFAQIYTSPIKRTFQTAQILGEWLNCPVEVADALREFDCGELEGKSDFGSWEIYDGVFRQWVAGNWAARIPGGESHLEIQGRFIPFIHGLIQKYRDENILLVGHGGTYRCMFPLVITNLDLDTLSELNIDHTMPMIVETRPDGLVCTHWGKFAFD